jgi:hypothetical protein
MECKLFKEGGLLGLKSKRVVLQLLDFLAEKDRFGLIFSQTNLFRRNQQKHEWEQERELPNFGSHVLNREGFFSKLPM